MEELQALWRKASATEEAPVSQLELDSLVSHQSSDELQKFRRVIRIEYVFTWLVIPLFFFGFFRWPEYRTLAVPFLALLGYLLYFYHRALRQFGRIHYEDTIQAYLQQALTFLRTYVRHYKIICWTSGGVGFMGGYFLEDSPGEDHSLFVPSSAWDLALTGGMVTMVLLLTHFYIKYLYQARINRLEQLLHDLSEQ